MNSLPGSSLDLRDRQLSEVDSPAAWRRLGFAVAVGTIGSVGMWSMPVALPFVQADFGIARADASLPYTLAMTGFALGGVAMGISIAPRVLVGSVATPRTSRRTTARRSHPRIDQTPPEPVGALCRLCVR